MTAGKILLNIPPFFDTLLDCLGVWFGDLLSVVFSASTVVDELSTDTTSLMKNLVLQVGQSTLESMVRPF